MTMPCLLRWFCLCLVWVAVSSFVPPSNEASNEANSDWEPVHAMRRRLGVSYNFTPSLLNPELCRYLSHDECRDADESLQKHAASMQQLPKLARQQNTNRKQAKDDLSQRRLNPSVGVVKVLVILLQFTDHMDRTLVNETVYDEMWNSKRKSELIPSGSVARWFQLNSYGQYEIEAVIVPWTVSDNTELYYSFGSSGLVTDFQRAFWPVLDRLDQNGIDWRDYDINNDGILDAVTVLHTGYAAELKGVDCNTNQGFSNRIWSHSLASSFVNWVSMDGRYQLGAYSVASAYRDTCNFEPARIGTMTHEFLHTLGLIDLYDGQDAQVGRGIGGFDIMATPYGPKDDPSWPGHISAWSRIRVGWLKPIEINKDGEYSIEASELSNQAYVIRKNYPYEEYLLIENRQPLWFDARLWTGGLVIYHIDDKADQQRDRGYPGQEGWPRNGNHYQVAVLASDGQYNLEKGDNGGDMGDFWQEGMTLGPGNGRVFPNTDAYQFGSIRVTGITIYDIKKVDTLMTFRVSGLNETPAPAPKPLPPATGAPTVAEESTPTEMKPTLPGFSDTVVGESPTADNELFPDTSQVDVSRFEGSAAFHRSFGFGIAAVCSLLTLGYGL